jgi:hypothetical protein
MRHPAGIAKKKVAEKSRCKYESGLHHVLLTVFRLFQYSTKSFKQKIVFSRRTDGEPEKILFKTGKIPAVTHRYPLLQEMTKQAVE